MECRLFTVACLRGLDNHPKLYKRILAHVDFNLNPSSDLGFGEISIHTIKSTSNNFDGRAKHISSWLVDLTIANDTSYRKAIFLRQIFVERHSLAKKTSLPIHTQSIVSIDNPLISNTVIFLYVDGNV